MDVFNLAAKISLDTSAYTSGLSSAKDALDKMGQAVKVFAGISAAAVGAASTAVAGFAKSALDSYSSYEQLVGGVDTLFKDSSAKVQEYADNAYKTAGLSANEYMETVTSFSASLLQSLSGDTDKAADIADTAIRDMSDNANKMGTAMESIQNAYQGFAKQNYTMLDNLKLGYGGTKSEMERLLKDANELNAKQGKYTDYQIENYADVVEAIHTVQTEIGITGTTSKEAASTIEGSTKSMKAAWDNLKIAIAKGDGSGIDKLISEFGESVGAMAQNMVPRLEIILDGIGQLIDKVGPMLADALPGIVESILPKLLYAGGSLARSIGTAMLKMVPKLVPIIKKLLISTSEAIKSNAGTVINGFAGVVQKIVDYFTENAPQFIQLGMDVLTAIANGVSENLPSIITSITELITFIADKLTENLPVILDAGISIVSSVAKGIVDNLPKLVDSAVKLMSKFASYLKDKLPKLIPAAVAMVMKIAETLTKPENLQNIVGAAVDIITGFVTGLINALPIIVREAPKIVQNLVDGLLSEESLGKLFDGAIEVITKLAEYISNPDNLIDIVKSGAQIVIALVKGMAMIQTMVWGKIGAILYECGLTIKGYYDIAVEWGEKLVEWIAEGIKKAKGKVTEALNDTIPEALKNPLSVVADIGAGGLNPVYGAYKRVSGIASLFHAEGGVVTRPQLGVVGEDGPEAIVPLKNNAEWIDRVAERMSARSSGVMIQTVNINFPEGLTVGSDYDVDRFVERVSERLESLKFAQNAAVGGVNW